MSLQIAGSRREAYEWITSLYQKSDRDCGYHATWSLV